MAKNYDELIKQSKSGTLGQIDEWGADGVNCYAFAVNCKNPGTAKPIPGGKAPPDGKYTAQFIRAGALKDGLKAIFFPENSKQINELKDYYMVAGFVKDSSGVSDHHWYREAKGEYWTHKPGPQGIRNFDGSNPPKVLNGNLLSQQYDHSGYTFVGYFFCPKKGLKLA